MDWNRNGSNGTLFWRIRNLSESNPEKSVIYRQQVAYVGDSPALKLTVRPW